MFICLFTIVRSSIEKFSSSHQLGILRYWWSCFIWNNKSIFPHLWTRNDKIIDQGKHSFQNKYFSPPLANNNKDNHFRLNKLYRLKQWIDTFPADIFCQYKQKFGFISSELFRPWNDVFRTVDCIFWMLRHVFDEFFYQ